MEWPFAPPSCGTSSMAMIVTRCQPATAHFAPAGQGTVADTPRDFPWISRLCHGPWRRFVRLDFRPSLGYKAPLHVRWKRGGEDVHCRPLPRVEGCGPVHSNEETNSEEEVGT